MFAGCRIGSHCEEALVQRDTSLERHENSTQSHHMRAMDQLGVGVNRAQSTSVLASLHAQLHMLTEHQRMCL